MRGDGGVERGPGLPVVVSLVGKRLKLGILWAETKTSQQAHAAYAKFVKQMCRETTISEGGGGSGEGALLARRVRLVGVGIKKMIYVLIFNRLLRMT